MTKSSGDARSPLSRALGRQFVFNAPFQTGQFNIHVPAEDLAELKKVTWTAWTPVDSCIRKLIDNNQNNPRFLFSTVARLTHKQMSPDLNIPSQFNSNDFMHFFTEKNR